MAKSSLHVLIWSEEHQRYELLTAGHRQQCFGQEDKQPWQDWLSHQTSFAFQGQHGHISVRKETRTRGAGYWYAYSTRSRQTNKRYLGPLTRVTLERLEEVARALAAENVSASRTKQRVVSLCLDVYSLAAEQGRTPLLASKQVPPQLPAALVERERLLHDMDAIFASRLLLLSAAAGSGKTTLLSSWMARSIQEPDASIWLSLDELDNDSTRFLFDAPPSEYVHAEEYLALARVYLAQQQYASCLRLLTQLLNKMEGMKRQWDIIQLLALQIVALHACGEVTQARQVAIRLLALTEPEGYMRVYMDAGEPMQQVLQSFLDPPGDDGARAAVVSLSSVSKILAAFEQEKGGSFLPQSAPRTPVIHIGTLSPTHAPSKLIEPLSPREQEVLRLVAQGASNQEIADQLVVSLTTVKKHVGSLLLKLTAENRTRAVARARELSLL